MKDCKFFQDLMAEALLGEITPEEKAALESHVAVCASCAAEYGALSQTLRIMDARERRDPGPEFWDGYWDRLMDRKAGEESAEMPRLPLWKKLTGFGHVVPRWALQTAAALVLVGVGILVGRLVLSPPSPQVARSGAGTQPQLVSASAADPETRARNYLDRSKLVILALVNYDPATQDPYGLDLPLQKKVSRELVTEASRLKNDLKGPRERRLRELVADLETIFIQIANLESENDLEAVEFVKQGVAARGVLLKINLSEMGSSSGDGKSSPPQVRRAVDRSSA